MPAQKLSYRVKGCDCDCATAPADPCEPCNAGAYQLQCRSRSGSAALCGYAELASPSTPPRYYLQASYGGNAEVKVYSGPGFGCSEGNEDVTTVTASGGKQWNPLDCSESVTATLDWTYVQTSGLPETSSGSCEVPGSPFGIDFYMNLCSSRLHPWGPPDTKTRREAYLWGAQIADPTEPKCGCTVGVNRATVSPCNAVFIQLTTEDTEQNAMDRSTAEWTCWSGSEGCSDLVTCCTGTDAGRTGRTFNFSQAEYRIRVKGAPGTLVNVVLTFGRSVGAPYEEIRQFVADGSTWGAWNQFSVITASGITTCLSGHRLYDGT